jgi:protein involved in sex pheromone biosynthesis
MISDLISKCEVGRHEVDIEDSQVTKDGIKLAEEYLNMLEQLRKSLRDALLSDIST